MFPNQNQSWNVHINSTVRGDNTTSWHAYGVAMDLGIYNYNEQNSLTAKGNKTYLWYIMDLIMDKYYESYKILHIIFEYTESNEINCLHIAFGNNQDMKYRETNIQKGKTDKNAHETDMNKISFGEEVSFNKKTKDLSTGGCWISKKGADGKYHVTESKENYYLYIASKYYNKCGNIDEVKKRFPSLPNNITANDLLNYKQSDSYYSQNVADKAKAIFEIINTEEGGFNNTDGSSCSPTYRGLTMEFQLEYNGDKASFPNRQNFWEEFLKKYPFTQLTDFNEKRANLESGTHGYAMLHSDNPYIRNCVYGGNSQWNRYEYLSQHIGKMCADDKTLTQEDVERLEKLLNDERYTKYYKNIKLDDLNDFVLSALICNFYYGEPGATQDIIKRVANTDKGDYTTMYKALNTQCNSDRQQTITNMYNAMENYYKGNYKAETAAKKITRMKNIKQSAENYIKTKQ